MQDPGDTLACRFCFEHDGPCGLQDALITPCACSGTAAHSHVSCLYRWQLTKAQSLLRDPDTCEICRQRYQIPPEAVRALVAQGHLPIAPRSPQLLRLAARIVTTAYRLLRPLLLIAEAATVLVGAVDYALQAHAMVPAVLADASLLQPYRLEWGLGMATLAFVLPVVSALRVGDNEPAAQLRRLRQGVNIMRAAFYASVVGAAAITDHQWNAVTLADANLAPHVRRSVLIAQDFDRKLLSLALPVAAAGVGVSSAWWRFWVLACWRPKAEAAALAAAAHRVLAWLRGVAERSGLLPLLGATIEAMRGSASFARTAEWAAVGWAWLGAVGGKPRRVGAMENLLWGIEARSGLDAAGAFSA